MNIKKINLVLLYTLFIFSLFTFSVYPKSHAKYFKEDVPLVYKIGLVGLYRGQNETSAFATGTTYDKAVYQFNFDRSTLVKDEAEYVSYRVVVDEVCNIESVSSTYASSTSINGNEATIEYSKNDNNADNIVVKYSCDVKDLIVTGTNGLNYINTDYEIYETYHPDKIEYLYMYGLGGVTYISLDNFYERYPIPEGIISEDKKTLKIPKAAENKYETFTVWVDEYVSTYLTDAYDKSVVKNYILDTFVDEASILGETLVLKGLEKEHNDENYVYVIDANLIGYAKTADAELPTNMYFSNPSADAEVLTNIFTYYLENYLYPNDSDSVKKVIDYVNSCGGVASIIKDSSITIAGLTYDSEEGLLRVSKNILIIINSINSDVVEIPHVSSSLQMMKSFNEAITYAYPDFIDQSVLDHIGTYETEIQTYRKKIDGAFDVYVIVDMPDVTNEDGTETTYEPLLFHMYSNYVETDTATHYNYVEVIQLVGDMVVEMTYSLEPTTDDYDGVDDMITDLASIDTALGQTHDFDTLVLTPTDTDGNYIDGTYIDTDKYYTTTIDNANNKITVKFTIVK